jgi:hypothetical protein
MAYEGGYKKRGFRKRPAGTLPAVVQQLAEMCHNRRDYCEGTVQ